MLSCPTDVSPRESGPSVLRIPLFPSISLSLSLSLLDSWHPFPFHPRRARIFASRNPIPRSLARGCRRSVADGGGATGGGAAAAATGGGDDGSGSGGGAIRTISR